MFAPACVDGDVVVVSAGDDGSMHVWDAGSGSVCATFKNNLCVSRCLASVNGRTQAWAAPTSQSLVAAQRDKPFMHVWHWGKDQVHLRCAAPEAILSLAVTVDGTMLFAGGTSGRIFCWELCSGVQLGCWYAHYKSVSALSFTQCGSALISGGEDAVLHAWDVSSVVDKLVHDPSARISSFRTFARHTLPVTNARCGMGGLSGRVFSVSLDRMCVIWGLHTSEPLATVVCPSPLTVVATNALEARLFMGASDGVIYSVDLHATAAAAQHTHSAHKATRTSAGAAVASSADSALQAYRGHSRAVTDVAVLPSGGCMVSASEDGSVKVWDVMSCQALLSFDSHQGPVRSLLLVAKSDSWFGLGGKKASSSASGVALQPVAHLRKHTGAASTDSQSLPLRVFADIDFQASAHTLPPSATTATLTHITPSSTDSAATTTTTTTTLALQQQIDALHAQIASLTSDNQRWQAVNNTLLQRLAVGGVAAVAPVIAPATTTTAAASAAHEPSSSSESATTPAGDDKVATAQTVDGDVDVECDDGDDKDEEDVAGGGKPSSKKRKRKNRRKSASTK